MFDTTRIWLGRTALLAATLGCAASVRAQDDPAGKPPQAPPRAETAEPSKPKLSIEQWIQRLGAERPAQRKAAEDALSEFGSAARSALEVAAEDHDDPEVRWRARRLLRNLDAPAERGRLRRIAPDQTGPEVGREGDNEPDANPELRRAFEGFRGFEELEQQMEDLRRQVEEMQRGFGAPGRPGVPFGGFWNGGDHTTSMQIGPDGVRLEVREGEGADAKRKVYEAPDLETFREKYPEVAKQFLDAQGRWNMPGLGGGRVPRVDLRGPLGWLRRGESAPEAVDIVPPVTAVPPAEGERLGIYVADLDPAVREFLGVEPEVGLLVERVEPESLAAALQLRAKDVVLKIGDTTLRSTMDVRAALRGIPAGEAVLVTVNRHGETVNLKAQKRHDAPEPKKLRKTEPKESEEVEAENAPPSGTKR
ncbi:MAG: PDZ domain-containing protein [Planctomycetota bacterium]